MRVFLVNHYTGRESVIEGTPVEVERKLLDIFPYYRSNRVEHQGDLEGLLELINATQGWDAEFDPEQDVQPVRKSEDDGDWWYHGTPEEKLASIAQGGLVPHENEREEVPYWQKRQKFVWLARDAKTADVWGARSAGRWEGAQHVKYPHAVLRFRLPVGVTPEEDPNLPGQPMSRVIRQTIHPESIERLDDDRWVPLVQMKKAERADSHETLDTDSPIIEAMLGGAPHRHPAFDAARFLAGGHELPEERLREAAWEHDGDPEPAALRAYGLPVTGNMLAALRAHMQISKLRKDEIQAVQAQEVVPIMATSQDAADGIRRAFKEHWVYPVQFGGKHSKGTLLARDGHTGTVFLLKPGSGGQSPAAGAKDDPASQSRREGAFWAVAEQWGVGESLPRADLVSVDGREYAALHLLPWNYQTMLKRQEQDTSAPRRLLHPFMADGLLHKWAALDWVCGNPDRHAQNIMVGPESQVVLIDHGSAFAGEAFNPAYDRNSFVPFYLRAWAPSQFNGLSMQDRLRYMPRLNDEAAANFKEWLQGLSKERLAAVLHQYGINPQPSVERLSKLKELAAIKPADEAVNTAWVIGV